MPAPVSSEIVDDFPFDSDQFDTSLLETSSISKVEIDALVLLKMMKHARDSFPSPATGQLLGIDVKDTINISNSFPFSSQSSESNELDGQEYQLQMLRCLRTLNFDANTVGWYQSSYMGSFWNQTLIETQYSYQKAFANSVVLVYDPAKTTAGNVSLRALRLSPQFMDLYESGEFTMDNLSKHKLTPSMMFENVPISIVNSHLLSAMAIELNESSSSTSLEQLSSTSRGPLRPNFDALNVSSETYLETHLEYLAETVEEHGSEQWRYQGWQRSYQRESQRWQQNLARMRLENEAAVAAGKPVLHSQDQLSAKPASLLKVLSNEPSRLETLLITNQIDTYCKQIKEFAGPALSKLFVAKSLHNQGQE